MTPEQQERRDRIQAIRERIFRCDDALSKWSQVRPWKVCELLSRLVDASDLDWVTIKLDSDEGRLPVGKLQAICGAALLEVDFATEDQDGRGYALAADTVTISPLNLESVAMHVADGDELWHVPAVVSVTVERSAGDAVVLKSDGTSIDSEWDAASALIAYVRTLRERISAHAE